MLTFTAGGGLRLTTASAAAPAATDLVTQVLATAAGQAQLPLSVVDEVPVDEADPRGLVPSDVWDHDLAGIAAPEPARPEEWDETGTPSLHRGRRGYDPGSRTALSFVLT